MSYVLDALRRAEADRQRGQVPHLHASTTLGTPGGEALATGQRVGPVGGVRLAAWALAAVGLLAAGAWWWGGAEEARVAHPAEPAPAPAAVAAPAPARAPGGTPDHTSPAAVEAVAPRPQAPLAAAPAVGPVPPPVALPVPAPRVPLPSPQADTPSPPGATPPMTFGGAFDSPDPKARMLIINGQVWREGDEPAPGWVLERIGLHEARFKVQGRAVDVRYDLSARR